MRAAVGAHLTAIIPAFSDRLADAANLPHREGQPGRPHARCAACAIERPVTGSRMHVGVDGRVFSTEAAERGMGRYVRGLVDHLHDAGCDVTLLLYDGNVIGADDPMVKRSKAVRHVTLDPNAGRLEDIHGSSELLDRIAREEGLDVFLDATPFIAPARLDLTACATVAVAFDLIPMRYPGSYLTSSVVLDHYRNGLDRLRKADAVIAISEFVKRHVVRYLGLARDSVTVVYPSLTPAYLERPVARDVQAEGIFCILGGHKSKNAERAMNVLVSAAAALGEPVRITVPTEGQAHAIDRLAAGRFRSLTFEWAIEEALKMDLQSRSSIVAHLSIDEGFGIPLLEAVFCGTKVLTVDNAMNREILGHGGHFSGAALLVAPTATEVDAEALRALRDAPRPVDYAQAVRDGFTRHWNAAPQAMRAAMDEAGHRFARWREGVRASLVCNSPANSCGVADYSSAIPLGSAGPMVAYTGDPVVHKLPAMPGLRIKSYLSYGRDREQDPRPSIFNLAISESLGFGVELLQAHGRSGDVVVVHDLAYLFGLVHYLRMTGREELLFEHYLVGEDEALAPRLREAIRDSLADFAHFQEIESAYSSAWLRRAGPRLVSHSPLVTDGEHVGGTPANPTFAASMGFVPMGIDDRAAPQVARAARLWRRAMGLTDSDLLVGAFGSVTGNKFLAQAGHGIAAHVASRRGRRRVFFALCGKVYESEVVDSIRNAFARAGAEGLLLDNPLSETDFDERLTAADLVIACRVQERVQMSHSLIRAMSLGRPLATNTGSGFGLQHVAAELADERFGAELAQLLDRIQADDGILPAMSRASRRAYERDHRIASMVASLLSER